jgi:hypothetical protein
MATYNDVTGDALVSRTLTEEGAKSFDRIFGEKKKKTNGGWTPPPLDADKLVSDDMHNVALNYQNKKADDISKDMIEFANSKEWPEERIDVIGQNGNIGYGE